MDDDFTDAFLEDQGKNFAGCNHTGVYLLNGSAVTLGANKAYQAMTGIDRNELIGLHARDVEKKGFINKSVSLIVKKTQAPISITQKILKTDKKIFATGNPIYDHHGNIILIAITATPFKSQKNRIEKSPQRILDPFSDLEGVIFKSDVMQQVLIRAIRAASMNSTILILGDSGVGKDVIARIIHQTSPRKDKNFIKINATAIPENLFESELFGYVGGAFTGARKEGKQGLIQAADGGTLFLDEISELPLSVQVKLLRVIQNKEVTRLGSAKTEKVDVRFIAATNRDLMSMVRKGRFREDLFYRLNVVPIYIPPLKERQEDIYVLSVHILTELCMEYKIDKQLTPAAIQVLTDYSWPGNVRELQNLIERMVALYSQKEITREHVLNELSIHDRNRSEDFSAFIEHGSDLQKNMEMMEKSFLFKVYKTNKYDMQKTAKALGIHRTTAMRKLRKFNLIA